MGLESEKIAETTADTADSQSYSSEDKFDNNGDETTDFTENTDLSEAEAETSGLDEAEINEIAGFDPEEDRLLEREYMLVQDEEESQERSLAEKGWLRAVVVAAMVGSLIALGWLFYQLFVSGDRRSPEMAEQSTEEQNSEITTEDETGQLKARLAFEDQQQAQSEPENPEAAASDPPDSSESETSQPSPESLDDSSSAPTPTSASSNSDSNDSNRLTSSSLPPRPQPSTVRSPSPPPSPPSPPIESPSEPATLTRLNNRASSPPPPSPTVNNSDSASEDVDPRSRWNTLASIGQSRASIGNGSGSAPLAESESPTTVNSPESEPQTSESSLVNDNNELRTATIQLSSAESSPTSTTYSSAGEQGIIEKRAIDSPSETVTSSTAAMNPEEDVNSQSLAPQQVAIGTTATATVQTPFYWDGAQGREVASPYFVVRFNEPLQDVNGEVALPTGTALIIEVQSVSANKLVTAQAIGLIYENRWGQVSQIGIEPYIFGLRGQDNAPLVAQSYNDYGDDIAKQDLLIATLNAFGQLGEVVNLPESVSTASASSGGQTNTTSSSTTVRQGEPSLVGAALQGFFQPLAQRLTERANRANQEMLNSPNLAGIEAGMPVSVVVESVLYVD